MLKSSFLCTFLVLATGVVYKRGAECRRRDGCSHLFCCNPLLVPKRLPAWVKRSSHSRSSRTSLKKERAPAWHCVAEAEQSLVIEWSFFCSLEPPSRQQWPSSTSSCYQAWGLVQCRGLQSGGPCGVKWQLSSCTSACWTSYSHGFSERLSSSILVACCAAAKALSPLHSCQRAYAQQPNVVSP